MDIVGKIISIILIFFMCIIGPMTNYAMQKDRVVKREVMNEVTSLIDKVTDTGELKTKEIADFKMAIAQAGLAADTKIIKYTKIATKEADDSINIQWVASDNLKTFKKGDIIQVKVKAIDYTSSQKFMMYLARFVTPAYEITQAGYIRN